MARSLSRIHGVPLTIARMNWSYGQAGFGGLPVRIITRVAQGEPVPVHPDWEFVGCPIHEDDMAEHLEGFFDGATVGGTITNWAGDDAGLGGAARPLGGRGAGRGLLLHRDDRRHRLPAQPRPRPADLADRPVPGEVAGRLPPDHRASASPAGWPVAACTA